MRKKPKPLVAIYSYDNSCSSVFQMLPNDSCMLGSDARGATEVYCYLPWFNSIQFNIFISDCQCHTDVHINIKKNTSD